MKRRVEDAVRSLGLFATYAGYFPLLDFVRQLVGGQSCGQELWTEIAERHGTSVRVLDSRFRRLMICGRRNAPERWEEWFGAGPVTMETFLQTIAKHGGGP